MRAQNERLVLSLVRRHGALAKSEIARMTGLSAQTVSVIMRHLEADHLLRRGTPQRGRVGQPMVPLSLDPEGAFFIGVKVGRRSLDMVLVDFVGGIRRRSGASYAFPTPDRTIAWVIDEVRSCEALLGERAGRIAGVGLAVPFELWVWAEEIGAPEAELAAWRGLDLRDALDRRPALPGLPAERRHRRLRRGARVRGPRRAHGLHLLLRRGLRRRRPGPQRRPVRRPHRQRGCARLDAGARRRGRHGAADRPRVARRARAPPARGRHPARRALRPRPPTGTASGRISTPGSRPRRAASPTRWPRPRRSSTSRRR